MKAVLTLLGLVFAARVFASTPSDDKNPIQPLKGNLAVLLKGDTLEVYVNGEKVHSSNGNDLRTIPLALRSGDCIVFRANSPYTYRSIRFAFVDQRGAVSFVGTPATTVIRRLSGPSAAVPKQRFDAPTAKSGRSDPKNSAWQDAKLPANAEPIGLPEKRATYEIAFTVPAADQAVPQDKAVQPALAQQAPAKVARPDAKAPDEDEKKFLAASIKWIKSHPHDEPGKKFPVPRIDVANLIQGDLGAIAGMDHLKVARVIDAHTLLVVPVVAHVPPLAVGTGSLGGIGNVGAAVQQAVLDQSANTTYEDGQPFYLITQRKTDGVAVGDKGTAGICEVAGTREDATRRRKRELVVLRELDMAKIAGHLKEQSRRN
jgi:hypothetical protein